MTTSSKPRFDVHEAITNQIIAAIEAGTGKLQMPWHRSGANVMRPVNVASGNGYRGINTVANGRIAEHKSARARNPR